MENVTKGLPYCFSYLSNRVLPRSRCKENALTICDYISSMKSEINPSDHYMHDYEDQDQLEEEQEEEAGEITSATSSTTTNQIF
jgi:hypothetical protein